MKSCRVGRIPTRVLLGIAALLILILRTTSAQAPAEQTASPTTKIKVTTRLVTVDVVAQDKNNRPVQGLTKDDFELLDEGQPQTISVFSVEGSEVTPAPGTAPALKAGATAALPPGTYANRPARPSDVLATATVILLDGLNTSTQNLAMARRQIEKLIPQLQPQDRVGLYSLLGKNIRIVQELTGDPSLLLQALKGERARLAPSQVSGHSAPPRANNDHLPMLDDGTALRTQQAGNITLGALEEIAQYLADVPGRKNLIWISQGLPITNETPIPMKINTSENKIQHPPPTDVTDRTSKIQETARVLSDYKVAVYPIDARGLSALSGRGAWKAQGTGSLLAKLTGGRTFYNDNDMALAIRSAIDDSKLTYVLGYYPAADKWDSQFHTFKVRVNRPGVKLLYRSGYLAVSEENPPPDDQKRIEQNQSPDDQRRMVQDALLSPLDSTAIGLRAQLQKSGGGGAQQLTLNLLVDINDLPLSHANNLWQGELEVVIAQLSPTGDVLSKSARKHSVKLNLKEDYYTQLQKQGLSLSFPIARDPHAV
jgi:VWFA-related protein